MGLAAEEVDDLLVDIAAVVVAQVQDERVLVEHLRMHLEQEGLQVLRAHRPHMDVTDSPAGPGRDPVGALLFPFLVRERLDGREGGRMDLGVELLAAAAERKLELVHRHGAGEVFLAVRGLVHPHAVHGNQLVAFPHVDPELVGRGVGQDAGDLVRGGLVEEEAGPIGAGPGLRLFLGAAGGEAQVRRVQFAQQVRQERPEVRPRTDVREERGIVVPDRRPVGAVEVHVVVILLQRGPGLVEHLPEFVVQDRLHVFLDLGLGGGSGGRVDLVDGAGGQAVQRILAVEESAAAEVLDRLRLRLRVGNLQGEDARRARAHRLIQEVVLALGGEDVWIPLGALAIDPGHPFVDVLEVDHDGRILLGLVLLVLEQVLHVLGLEGGVILPERKLVQGGTGSPGKRGGCGVGQQVHVFPVGREDGIPLHGSRMGEIPQASVLEVVQEDVALEAVHGVEGQPGAIVGESEVVPLEGPEFGLGHPGGGAGFRVIQHHGTTSVDESELFPLPVGLQAVAVVLRTEDRRFAGAAVGRDPVDVGPALVRPGVVDGLAVIGPDHFVHALVRRGVQLPEVLAFRVGDVQAAADD